jgi:hypothetical protein
MAHEALTKKPRMKLSNLTARLPIFQDDSIPKPTGTAQDDSQKSPDYEEKPTAEFRANPAEIYLDGQGQGDYCHTNYLNGQVRFGHFYPRLYKYCIVVVLLLGSWDISQNFRPISPLNAALPGSPARQPCPAALPGSLARQPCRNITTLITGRSLGRQNCKLYYGRRPPPEMQHCILLPARPAVLFQAFPAINKTLRF